MWLLGSGINPAPVVTTGGSSGVTSNSATLAGTATSACAAITAYGIEYSTTNGFPNGTGIQVPSTNIAGGNFQQQCNGALLRAPFTTIRLMLPTRWVQPMVRSRLLPRLRLLRFSSASALTAFGNVCINTTAGPNSFTITGTGLTNANVTVAALTGYSYATAAGDLIPLR